MLTGDYCGTGMSFTEDGTSLYWQNAAGWSSNNLPPSTAFEAYWNGNGARCLDTPRLGMEIKQDIMDECAAAGKPLPPCADVTGPFTWMTEKPL
jgi:hypothetical protein